MAALSVNNFCDDREALYGVFDGDRNVEIPYLLQCTMSDILAEELQKSKTDEEYMTNTFLVMQRLVKSSEINYIMMWYCSWMALPLQFNILLSEWGNLVDNLVSIVSSN